MHSFSSSITLSPASGSVSRLWKDTISMSVPVASAAFLSIGTKLSQHVTSILSEGMRDG